MNKELINKYKSEFKIGDWINISGPTGTFVDQISNMDIYNKPKTYKQQATVETVNAGMPYYVASPKYGYEGGHIPVAGSVSGISDIDKQTGELKPASYNKATNLWVTCTASRYQFNRPFRRCSLSDDGVVHQTYSPRMAFLDPFSAKYYAETGKLPQ